MEAAARTHLDGSGNYTLELHKLMSLELIERMLVCPVVSGRSSAKSPEVSGSALAPSVSFAEIC